jgi:hypothetical protein
VVVAVDCGGDCVGDGCCEKKIIILLILEREKNNIKVMWRNK